MVIGLLLSVAAATATASGELDDDAAALLPVSSSPPVVFWSSEGHEPNTTVMAMGGGLEGATVQLQDATSGQPLPAPQVLDSWDASVKFILPSTPISAAYRFRACSSPAACSGWRSLNSPDITWASGDRSANASSVATAGGWLKVYGRSLGFTTSGHCAAATVQVPGPASGTVASMRSGSTSIKLTPSVASCYDASFALPPTLKPGHYNFSIVNRLSAQAGSVAVTIVGADPWPSRLFHVHASGKGSDVVTAVAAAGAAGGGIVQLSAGTFDMGGASLAMPRNVQLVGAAANASILRWSKTATTSLISNGINCTRYMLAKLRVEVMAAQGGNFVIDITGHGGTKITDITVWMPHSLATSATVVHTHSASGFEVTGCTLTHDNEACQPGYPHASIFFFDVGTESGLVSNNTGFARCTAFVGYSASGILLEGNHFTELPYGPHSKPGGNGFASFGSPRKSERVSYSRNIYQGFFNGDNSPDGSFPHEGFSSDGTGGAYAGLVTAADAGSVSVPGNANAGYVDGAVAILMGKGRGQYRSIASVSPPAPTPPQRPPPPFPEPAGWHVVKGHNGSRCDSKILWQGAATPEACVQKCAADAACHFATVDFFASDRPGAGYCVHNADCSKMVGWDNHPCVLKPPACMPQNATNAHVATYSNTGLATSVPATSGTYFLETPWDVVPDKTSWVTIIPFVGNTFVIGNDVRNSTTFQIYGCGFNVIFAGNTLKHMYVTEKCIGSSGISIYGIDYQGGIQPNINFELTGNTLTDTEGLRVIGGDSINATISMGHIVRRNTVIDKIAPPEPWLGPSPITNPDWRSSRNMRPAIEIGIAAACLAAENKTDGNCGRSASRACYPYGTSKNCTIDVELSNFEDIVVEGNDIHVKRGNGTCELNGYSFGAKHTIDRNNRCSVGTSVEPVDVASASETMGPEE